MEQLFIAFFALIGIVTTLIAAGMLALKVARTIDEKKARADKLLMEDGAFDERHLVVKYLQKMGASELALSISAKIHHNALVEDKKTP